MYENFVPLVNMLYEQGILVGLADTTAREELERKGLKLLFADDLESTEKGRVYHKLWESFLITCMAHACFVCKEARCWK